MSNQLALVKKDTVDVVAARVREFQERGEIHFPANYSPENAMKSAWLILQNTLDREKRPVLEVCTKDSVANSLLDMVVQGLNPAKKQGYFIAYGKQLTFQRSYFGTMAVTKRVTGAKDIFAEVVYEGDDFEFEIDRGRKRVLKHKQTLTSISGGKILAAYCTIILDDNREFTDIMTMDEIRQAWKKSKQNPDKDGSTHQEFPQEMAKRTVINRTCKSYMNTSDDSSLVMQHFNRQDETVVQAEVEAEIAANANSETIDVDYEVVDEQKQPSKTTAEREQENLFDHEPSGQSGGPGF
ncbi:recombinase RecT [Brevibacillus panacihumi]|uniref:recombinase RecT n=1 Tax=Brevibacillus panacihumi TaxID=497735 RepID=UPI003D23894B